MLQLAQDPDADALLDRDPLALLIGMLLDQQFPMERAFAGPAGLARRLGVDHLDARALAEYDPAALAAVFTGPPALHRHPSAELYRVDRGELVIYREEQGGDVRRIRAPAGSVVAIPGGAAHTIRNESDADAHAHVVFAPGTEMEAFMRAATEAGTPADVMALAARHGVELLQAAASPSRTA